MAKHAHYETQREVSLRSAEETSPHVLHFVSPRSIVDVGCGVGAWLSVFANRGGVDDILGIDGEEVPHELMLIPQDKFMVWDLRTPIDLQRRFDLVISLEVAEHLPEQQADAFVESLVSLGTTILFSAAIPYQGGPGHVNEQWPGYWARLFEKRNYVAIDGVRPKIWNNPNVSWWFRQNILLFVERETATANEAMNAAWRRTNTDQLSLVHPDKYVDLASSLSLRVLRRCRATAGNARRWLG